MPTEYAFYCSFALIRHGQPLTVTLWDAHDHSLLTYDYHDGRGNIAVAAGINHGFNILNTNCVDFVGDVIGHSQNGAPYWTGYKLTLNNSLNCHITVTDPHGHKDEAHSFQSPAEDVGTRQTAAFDIPSCRVARRA
ncbi:MAG: hypothetical protein J0L97_10915 [Alphaproteobacteria bacterium]|nr:hypothetical protein [Alphaproteobacteria bacterium]